MEIPAGNNDDDRRDREIEKIRISMPLSFVVGTAIALLGLGIGLASVYWAPTSARLARDLTETAGEVAQMKEQVAAARAEVDRATQKILVYGSAQAVQDEYSIVTTGGEIQPERSAVSTNPETRAIDAGSTGVFFGGRILISVVALAFEGDPLRHRVVAVVSAPDHGSISLDHVDVGYVTTYQADRPYEVRVIVAGTSSAAFQIRRL